MERPYDDLRAAFTEADTRFKEALTSAFTAHTQCVAMFLAALERVEKHEAELQENDIELRRLILEQGEQLRELRQRLEDR